MYSFLVYFASVAQGFQICFGVLCGITLFSILGYFIFCDNMKLIPNNKFIISFAFLMVIFGFSCAAIPSEKDIYKIAATIGQDKTVLTPLGDVK